MPWAEDDLLVVRCYGCHGVGAVPCHDQVADRGAWPALGCLFTVGCAGAAEPEALN